MLCRTTPRDRSTTSVRAEPADRRPHRRPGVRPRRSRSSTAPRTSARWCSTTCSCPTSWCWARSAQGWAQNTSELAYERGGPDRWLSTYLLVEELLRRTPTPRGSPSCVELLGEAVAKYWVLHQLSLSVARSIDRGGAPAVESSLVKEMGTRFEQDVVEPPCWRTRDRPEHRRTTRFRAAAARRRPSRAVVHDPRRDQRDPAFGRGQGTATERQA